MNVVRPTEVNIGDIHLLDNFLTELQTPVYLMQLAYSHYLDAVPKSDHSLDEILTAINCSQKATQALLQQFSGHNSETSYRWETLLLQNLIRKSVHCLQILAAKREIALHCVLPSLPVWVQADKDQLVLALNSITAFLINQMTSPAQVIVLMLIQNSTAKTPGKADITIQPSLQRKNISALQEACEDLLGRLVVSKKIIEEHRGKIKLSNAECPTFQISLPLMSQVTA